MCRLVVAMDESVTGRSSGISPYGVVRTGLACTAEAPGWAALAMQVGCQGCGE